MYRSFLRPRGYLDQVMRLLERGDVRGGRGKLLVMWWEVGRHVARVGVL
jgi:hypothetical protein